MRYFIRTVEQSESAEREFAGCFSCHMTELCPECRDGVFARAVFYKVHRTWKDYITWRRIA